MSLRKTGDLKTQHKSPFKKEKQKRKPYQAEKQQNQLFVEIGDENPPSEIQVVEISSEIDNNNHLKNDVAF